MEWKILHEYDGEEGNPLFCQAEYKNIAINVFYINDEFQVEIEDNDGVIEISKLADCYFKTMKEAQEWIEKELTK